MVSEKIGMIDRVDGYRNGIRRIRSGSVRSFVIYRFLSHPVSHPISHSMALPDRQKQAELKLLLAGVCIM